ncbi:TPA: hypothetical protein DEF17_09810 [bacterium]|nr:MAG: hypothetical protein AUJ18_09200 [Candidatus Hydrogenedentes bacterium CG1_02_42_14]PIU46652.1 MAG: hypothetical protein COS94_09500 [Candidatus Hydrogenedentes bacterium CG07_land_8_20_14_0_80_42_17]HBW48202.1 hypothetical protein [bacterium]
MGRPPRIDLEDYWYHVIARGNERQRIFKCPADYEYYLKLLDDRLYASRGNLGAYCLMPNHIHILIRRGSDMLSSVIHNVHSKYSHDFNRIYGRDGHLFQGRYKSFIVLDDSYLESLIFYIHENPRRAGLETKEQRYLWSSEKYYMGKKCLWKSFVKVPGYEGKAGINNYKDLLKSRLEKVTPNYKTFIGTMQESIKINKRRKDRQSIQSFDRRERETIENIANRYSANFKITIKEMRGLSRDRNISRIRKDAIKEMLNCGYGPSEIGRYFNRTSGYVNLIRINYE